MTPAAFPASSIRAVRRTRVHPAHREWSDRRHGLWRYRGTARPSARVQAVAGAGRALRITGVSGAFLHERSFRVFAAHGWCAHPRYKRGINRTASDQRFAPTAAYMPTTRYDDASAPARATQRPDGAESTKTSHAPAGSYTAALSDDVARDAAGARWWSKYL